MMHGVYHWSSGVIIGRNDRRTCMAKNRKLNDSAQPSRRGVPLLHVIPDQGGWAVRSPRKVVSTHDTEEQARNAAIALAKGRGADVVVHDAHGDVKEHVSGAEVLLLEIVRDVYHHPERWNF